jgi:hypothetical protein
MVKLTKKRFTVLFFVLLVFFVGKIFVDAYGLWKGILTTLIFFSSGLGVATAYEWVHRRLPGDEVLITKHNLPKGVRDEEVF